MKVIIICEFSGRVRDAFIRLGHDAVSCDLLPSLSNIGPHIQEDINNVDVTCYDLAICHPPCTYLANVGSRWFKKSWFRYIQRYDALQFVKTLWNLPIPLMALENPRGKLSQAWMPPTQIVHPYHFGDRESKATCLWLRGGLRQLQPTNVVTPTYRGEHTFTAIANKKERSITFPGMAEAMAHQWGNA